MVTNINHDVCITHMKWAPCLIKYDFKPNCSVIHNSPTGTDFVRMYHSGQASRADIVEMVAKNFDHNVEWTDGVA